MSKLVKSVVLLEQSEFGRGDFPLGRDELLDDVISALQKLREQVPAEHRPTALCEITAEDECSASIRVSYRRPLTPEEVLALQEDERARAAMHVSDAREQLALAQRRLDSLLSRGANQEVKP